MSKEQQAEVLLSRKRCMQPWHSPPHLQNNKERFHIIASCYDHKNIMNTILRLEYFEKELLSVLRNCSEDVYAWCILRNHYHILVKSYDIRMLLTQLGKLHGRTSYYWNKEDDKQGRKIWYNMLEHGIKSDRHFWATMNYIHNNPVKHGYIKKWQDWKYSSARLFLEEFGVGSAKEIWVEYNIDKMGAWDK